MSQSTPPSSSHGVQLPPLSPNPSVRGIVAANSPKSSRATTPRTTKPVQTIDEAITRRDQLLQNRLAAIKSNKIAAPVQPAIGFTPPASASASASTSASFDHNRHLQYTHRENARESPGSSAFQMTQQPLPLKTLAGPVGAKLLIIEPSPQFGESNSLLAPSARPFRKASSDVHLPTSGQSSPEVLSLLRTVPAKDSSPSLLGRAPSGEKDQRVPTGSAASLSGSTSAARDVRTPKSKYLKEDTAQSTGDLDTASKYSPNSLASPPQPPGAASKSPNVVRRSKGLTRAETLPSSTAISGPELKAKLSGIGTFTSNTSLGAGSQTLSDKSAQSFGSFSSIDSVPYYPLDSSDIKKTHKESPPHTHGPHETRRSPLHIEVRLGEDSERDVSATSLASSSQGLENQVPELPKAQAVGPASTSQTTGHSPASHDPGPMLLAQTLAATNVHPLAGHKSHQSLLETPEYRPPTANVPDIQLQVSSSTGDMDVLASQDLNPGSSRQHGSKQNEASDPVEEEPPPPPHSKRTLKDFTVERTLGKGAFARVHLVRSKETATLYAMKCMRKDRVLKTHQVENVINERNLMARLRCPFLVPFIESFQDNEHLYILVEFLAGGDLFHLLRHRQMFDEETTQFYGCQVLLALHYLHRHKIVFRDLKPENILLTAEGNAKLGDFGFAKIIEGTTTTFCGTPSYIPPEMLQRKPYGFMVDWWGYGVLLFEMASGCSPFQSWTCQKTYERILSGKIQWPPPDRGQCFSDNLLDLIIKLLVLDPRRRVGYKGDGDEVRRHRWFAGVDWRSVNERKITPPDISSDRRLSRIGDSVAGAPSLGIRLSESSVAARKSTMEIAFEDF